MAMRPSIGRLAGLNGACVSALLCWGVVAYGQATAPSDTRRGGGGSTATGEMVISETSLRSGLGTTDLEVIDRYVTNWAEKLATAGSEEDILDARVRLTRGYNTYDSWQFQNAYADRVAKALTPVLTSPDLRKQINAAMVLSQMRQVSMQPILESLVVSPNPALRLYGWTGYGRIRLLVMAQGKGPVETMLTSLTKAAAEEDCGPVMSAILSMMYLSPDRPSIISASVFDETRAKLFDVFRQSWPRVCRKVLGGHYGMVRAANEGLDALRRVAADPDSPKETQQAAVQMVVDLAWCAAKCYAAEGQTGSQMAATEVLLRECETALNAITKLRQIPVNKALTTKGDAERVAAVELATSSWIRLLENANWPVREPKFELPETTTQPESASLPAGQ